MNSNYKSIPKEKFEFAHVGTVLHDEKLKTKSRGYFADAFLRFKKNKSSVAAAFIIGILILFSIVSPIISPYTMNNKDNVYKNFPPFIESIADLEIGILNGSQKRNSQNELQINKLKAIAVETGYNPIIGEPKKVEIKEIFKGQERITYAYSVDVNRYYAEGVVYMNISHQKYAEIQEWQNETGIQVIYPYVEQKDIYVNHDPKDRYPAVNAGIWYKCSDAKGTPIFDENGNFIPVYSTNTAKAGPAYNSKRVEGDDGSYIYAWAKGEGSVECRIAYYNYYQYVNGRTPTYVFGTDNYGRDLFLAIGMGARFSLVFAVLVSAINLTIGAIYGAIQGYYGGVIDLAMDRVSDVLSGVPSIVVVTLFKLHLAEKVGTIPSFLFAFVLTGWIGMAALTRKQFYRFKSQEYVMAARTLGASDSRLMFKHIFPNSLGTMVTSCVLVIPGVISSETSLTYLGIVNLSEFVGTSIGELMASGQATMTASPHAMFFPAIFVSLLLISFNLFGNGLRDAFNPSTRGVED